MAASPPEIVNYQDAPLGQKRPLFRRKSRHEQNLAGYLFIAPWLIGFFLLTLYPVLWSLYLSFTNDTLFTKPGWIGLLNFVHIFTMDTMFDNALVVTFVFVLISVPVRLFFSLMVALLLSRNIKGMSVYRTAIYFPSLIGGSVAVSVLWKNMFGATGYLNHVLGWFGMSGVAWLTDPRTALGSLILLNAWQFGSTMVIFLAGLKQIPKDLYESAEVDGARTLRRFFSITLPMLSPVMFFNLVLGIIGAFQQFTSAFVITNGGPMNATYFYALYLYTKAFTDYQIGYASALAWILLVIIAILTGINFALSRKWVYYESDGGW